MQGLWRNIGKAAGRLLPRKGVADALGADVEGGGKMAAAIGLWARLYTDDPPWLYDGYGRRDPTVQTLGLPAAIAGKLAKLATLEMTASLSGSARAAYLDAQLRPVMDRIRTHAEHACALGGLAFKPYIDGGTVAVAAAQADAFFPTAFNGRGEVTAAVFAEQAVQGRYFFTKLEHHALTDAGYRITNRAFRSRVRDTLGVEVPLDAVDAWADLLPEALIEHVSRPLFAYFRIPQANTADRASPLGASVFARAAGQIRQADMLHSGILWEYEGSQLAVDADLAALAPDGGGAPGRLPQRDARLFRSVGLSGGAGGDFYQVFSPPIRDASLFNGLNRQLQHVERACGLSFGTLSDPQSVDRTATEIKSSKQEMYATVTEIQKALQAALEQLVYAMDVWATLGRLAPAGRYHLAVHFDDGVLNDPDVQKQQDLQEVRDGILGKAEYRMKWYGEDEAAARAALAALDG